MSDTKTPAPVHPLRSQADVFGRKPAETWTELEQACTETFNGGHHTDEAKGIFDHGMGTVFNLLRAEFPPIGVCKSAPTLAAENARLRAALEEIIYQADEGMPISDIHQCIVVAREVLASLTT